MVWYDVLDFICDFCFRLSALFYSSLSPYTYKRSLSSIPPPPFFFFFSAASLESSASESVYTCPWMNPFCLLSFSHHLSLHDLVLGSESIAERNAFPSISPKGSLSVVCLALMGHIRLKGFGTIGGETGYSKVDWLGSLLLGSMAWNFCGESHEVHASLCTFVVLRWCFPMSFAILIGSTAEKSLPQSSDTAYNCIAGFFLSKGCSDQRCLTLFNGW